MRTFAIITVLLVSISVPCLAAETAYKDVPKDHWAAESVKTVTDAGVMRGYPDGTFKGDKSVTRYDMAVAIHALMEALSESRKPLVSEANPPASTNKAHWASESIDFLKKNEILPTDAKALKDGDKPISQQELSEMLAAVAAKLIEEKVPAENTVK